MLRPPDDALTLSTETYTHTQKVSIQEVITIPTEISTVKQKDLSARSLLLRIKQSKTVILVIIPFST